KNEVALHNVEWLAVLAADSGGKLDQAAHDQTWRELLLNQFHDILPGSSVTEVYDDARESHHRIEQYCREQIHALAARLAQRIDTGGLRHPVILFNTLPWDRREPIDLPDGRTLDSVTVPAGGWTVVDLDAT